MSSHVTAMPTTKPKPISAPTAAASSRRIIVIGALAAAAIIGGVLAFQIFRGRGGTPTVTGKVVNEFPHDSQAWTQGLTIHDGHLYEGTGQKEQSTLRRVDLKTGRTLQHVALDPRVFGEGITVVGDRIYQLSWQSRVCFVYDRESFREIGRFQYEGEGWGLTYDGRHLVMSNGTSLLQFIDPSTFKVVRRVWVKDGRRIIDKLNELEFVEGEIWANIWYQDRLVRINPQTGAVVGYVDLAHLWPRRQRPDRETVLNGIAYDAKAKRLFVTGKLWPKLFEISVP